MCKWELTAYRHSTIFEDPIPNTRKNAAGTAHLTGLGEQDPSGLEFGD